MHTFIFDTEILNDYESKNLYRFPENIDCDITKGSFLAHHVLAHTFWEVELA